MTFREIDFCLQRIHVRTHNAYVLRAALHGVKLPLIGLSQKDKMQHTNPENADKAKKLMEKAIARKQKQNGFKVREQK